MGHPPNRNRRASSVRFHHPKRASRRLLSAVCPFAQNPRGSRPATPPADLSGDLRRAKARLCTALQCSELADLLLREAKTDYWAAQERWELSERSGESNSVNLPLAGPGNRP